MVGTIPQESSPLVSAIVSHLPSAVLTVWRIVRSSASGFMKPKSTVSPITEMGRPFCLQNGLSQHFGHLKQRSPEASCGHYATLTMRILNGVLCSITP
jgi:hypothetical protein